MSELQGYTHVPMKTCDLICHHPYTLNYSSTNSTDQIRMALTYTT